MQHMYPGETVLHAASDLLGRIDWCKKHGLTIGEALQIGDEESAFLTSLREAVQREQARDAEGEL